MIIHSKFRDYYDSALSLGRDETLHFVRESVSCVVSQDDLSWMPTGSSRWGTHRAMPVSYDNDMYFSVFVVGFCGKLYYGIEATDLRFGGTKKKFFFDNGFKGLFETFDDEKNKVAKTIELTKGLMSFCKKNNQLQRDNVFVEYGVPYFSIDVGEGQDIFRSSRTLTKLPILKDYGFQRVKDPFTAMQEISMYLGGVLPRQEREVINISDKDRIAQHGFDKFSFRHPTK